MHIHIGCIHSQQKINMDLPMKTGSGVYLCAYCACAHGSLGNMKSTGGLHSYRIKELNFGDCWEADEKGEVKHMG